MNREVKRCTGEIITQKNGVNIINCEVCKYMHTDPLPSFDEVSTFYKDDYYEEIKPEMLSDYEDSIDWFNQMYDDRLLIFEEILGKKSRLLDIGAGAGYFLKRSAQKGWDYYGIEASKAACAYAKKYNNINIDNNLVENVENEKIGKVDAINMSEFLEHVLDPGMVIKKSYEILNDNGVIFIMIPNEFNRLQMISNKLFPKSSDYWVVPDHHYNYFNKKSITYLLESNGFKVFKYEVSFPIETLLVSGNNYIENRELSKSFYNGIKNFELNLVNNDMRQLKRDIYSKFAELEIGRDFMVYAQKQK